MKDSPTITLRHTSVLLLALLLAACDTTGVQSPETASEAIHESVPTDAVAKAGLDADVLAQLAELRRATARFHRFEVAVQNGYDVDLTGCLENQPQGGMGHHYGNLPLDDHLDVSDPEALLFEPGPDGEMRLVGVEYIATGSEFDTPPTLMGQTFVWNPVFNVWTLHAWVWKNNPNGVFAAWNPMVSCDYAAN